MTNEDLIYLIIPNEYKSTYKRLLYALSDFGKDIIRNCNNDNKILNSNIISCWNLFQAALSAKEIGNEKAANLYINYIDKQLDIIYKNSSICNFIVPTPSLPGTPDIPEFPDNSTDSDDSILPNINNKLFVGFHESATLNFDFTQIEDIKAFIKTTNDPKGIYEVNNNDFGDYLWIAIPTTMNVYAFTTGGGAFIIPMDINKETTILNIDGKDIVYNYWRSSVQCIVDTFSIEINFNS